MPTIDNEDATLLLEKGVCLKTRLIYIGGITDYERDDGEYDGDAEIYWNTARRLILNLHLLTSDIRGTEPIKIVMNSCGGDWFYGMAIYDAIKQCSNHITILNMSWARSMTSLILQAGDERVMSPHGIFMIHDGETAFSGSPSSSSNWNKYEEDVIIPKMYKIYLSRIHEKDSKGNFLVDIDDACNIINLKLPSNVVKVYPSKGMMGITLKHIKGLCNCDTIFLPEETVALNLADRLLEEDDLSN